jgi:4'-phosphopantetheinyl transferase EntD
VFSLLAPLLPPQTVAAEVFSDVDGVRLFPAEEAVVARAVAERRAEFATGRACARAALAALGLPTAPILPGVRGEPRWPAGVVGSITHCAGYRACAAGRRSDVLAIGIDAEPDRALPDGLLEDVATPSERDWLADLMTAMPHVSWDRLLFSVKESAYKAWFQLTRRPLLFGDFAVSPCPDEIRFSVRVREPSALAGGRSLARLEANWVASGDLLITAVSIPA